MLKPPVITIRITAPHRSVKQAVILAAQIADDAQKSAEHGNTPASIKSVQVTR